MKSEEFGDQRAKDLIDKAGDKLNPRQAIRLLNQALQYGQDGIQASKAYLDLGWLYSNLGDTENAIDCYTKSIDACKYTPSIAHYWRGELYYQKELWEKALDDFEQAIVLGITSPEYEQAQEYLTKLRTRRG